MLWLETVIEFSTGALELWLFHCWESTLLPPKPGGPEYQQYERAYGGCNGNSGQFLCFLGKLEGVCGASLYRSHISFSCACMSDNPKID